MILVDSSVWIAHFDRDLPDLRNLLKAGEIQVHPLVIGEVSLGNLQPRERTLSELRLLPAAAMADHDEIAGFIERHQLWKRSLSLIDVHLLASALLEPDGLLWTFDKRLASVVAEFDIAFEPLH